MLILGHRCPLFLAIRSFHGCSMGATPSRSAQGVCRAAAVAGYAQARGFRKRPRRAPSSLRSAEHFTGEGHYEAGQVDDWGVNRDMQQEYRAPLEKELEACKGSAANLLAFRPHSRAELAGKLTDKGYDHATIDAALSRIQDLGLQSDRDFAATFARSKWRQSRWAPSRIRIELVRKGVPKADIEGGLREVFGDEADAQQQLSGGGAHPEERLEGAAEEEQSFDQQLLAAAQRQAAHTRGMPPETRRRRMVAWLQRRGHGWATVSALLKQLAL